MKKIKIIAVIAAVVVALGVFLFLRELSKPQIIPHTTIVVAAVNIPENTQITEDMLTTYDMPTEAMRASYIRDADSAVGMVTSGAIYAGEPVVTNRLERVGVDESKTLAYKVEDGMRAVTIAVNATTGLSNMIKPGNRADIIMNYTFEREVEREEPAEDGEDKEPETEKVQASRFLVQNVPVLAVGSVLSKDGTAEYATVTFQVTPEEALEISFAEFTSSLRVILRSPLDEKLVGETEMELDVLRGEGEEATAP